MKQFILLILLIYAPLCSKGNTLSQFDYKDTRSIPIGLRFMEFNFNETDSRLRFKYAIPLLADPGDSVNPNEFLYPYHRTYIDCDGHWEQCETLIRPLRNPSIKSHNANDGVFGVCVNISYLKPQLLRAVRQYNYSGKFIKIKFRLRALNQQSGEQIMLDTEPILIELKNNGMFLVGYWKTSKNGREYTYSNTAEYTPTNMIKLEKPLEIVEIYTPKPSDWVPPNCDTDNLKEWHDASLPDDPIWEPRRP